MLIEIKCDKFKTTNNPTDIIRFHPGLNVINGSNEINNSVGKSTLLQIIDFVLGGEDYLKTEAAKKLGPHKFYFSFKFENEDLYYMRQTDKKSIIKCDSNYHELEELPLDQYRQILLEKYKLTGLGLTFRNLTSPFLRLSSRNIDSKKDVLKVSSNEKTEMALNRIEALYEKYEHIKQLKEAEKLSNDELSAYSRSQKFGYLDMTISNDKELEGKEQELQNLKDEYEMLINEENIHSSSVEIPVENKALLYRNKITIIRRERSIAENRLNFVKENLSGENFLPSNTIARLKEFFPDANIPKLEEIENFHKQLTENLKTEFKEEELNLEKKISEYETEISNLELEIEHLGLPKTVSKSYLEDIIAKKEEIQKLEKQIQSFKTKRQLLKNTKINRKSRKETESEILSSIQDQINLKIEELNTSIYGNSINTPSLEFNNCSSYSYKTDGDDGDGTSLKNAIIFDLAVLSQTKLPVILHDTIINKEINKNAHGKIINLYRQFENKQIFTCIDEVDKYDLETQKIIEANSVVHLSEDNELFGIKFDKKEKN